MTEYARFVLCSIAAIVLRTEALHAVEITVGATTLSIPAPPGFAPVTDAMQPYADIAKQLVVDTNEQYALFISQADATIASSGGMPDGKRRFSVQAAKAVVDVFATTEDFRSVTRAVRAENQRMAAEARAKMPEQLDKMSQGLAESHKVEARFKIDGIVAQPPHEETPRSIAYSMLMTGSTQVGQQSEPYADASTVTTVHVRGKVLFLYAFSDQHELEWTRTESAKWTDAILAANPSSPNEVQREAATAKRGIDWGEVGSRALIGAVIGVVVSGLAAGYKRWRRS